MSQDHGPDGAAVIADELRRARPDLAVTVFPPTREAHDFPVLDSAGAQGVALESTATAEEIIAEIELVPSERFERWQRVEGDVFTHLTTARFDLESAEAAFDGFLRVRWVLEQARWALRPMDSPTPWFVAGAESGVSAEVATRAGLLELVVASRQARLPEVPS